MLGARQVVWAPKAKEDLRNIWRYFARVASPEIADTILGEIGQAGERLSEQPLSWRTRHEIMPGLRSTLAHPYAVFHRVTPTGIEIVRIVHERRNFATIFPKTKL